MPTVTAENVVAQLLKWLDISGREARLTKHASGVRVTLFERVTWQQVEVATACGEFDFAVIVALREAGNGVARAIQEETEKHERRVTDLRSELAKAERELEFSQQAMRKMTVNAMKDKKK